MKVNEKRKIHNFNPKLGMTPSKKKSTNCGCERVIVKKSRKHAYSPESDNERKHKKHKKDSRSKNDDGAGDVDGQEELEDGVLGEDGEIQ
nr:pre-mRNA-processing protein 40A [Tanacetum cinerariifolium]